jgi:hypothetical protein
MGASAPADFVEITCWIKAVGKMISAQESRAIICRKSASGIKKR